MCEKRYNYSVTTTFEFLRRFVCQAAIDTACGHRQIRRDSLSKQDVIEVEGVVSDSFPNAMFEVKLQNGHKILATISGKLRMNFIRILPGDKVTVELSPYDLSRGRITWRGKN